MPARAVFADAFYWVALLFPRDAFHARVVAFSRANTARLVTTDEVLIEVANWFATGGRYWRMKVADLIDDLRSDPEVDVVPQTRADFDVGLDLFKARLDKGYSLTDCRSMNALRDLGIIEVLTNDHHFTQEGFTILFPSP